MNNIILILFLVLLVINLYIKKNEYFDCISYEQLIKMPNLDTSKPFSKKIKYSKTPFENETGDIDPNKTEYKSPEYSECKICKPGEYISMYGCSKCPINQISTQENEFICDICEEDEYTNGTGGTECLNL